MYLHIGNGKSVKGERIIGVFDLDTATVSKISKDFINRKQRSGKVEYTDSDLPRTFLIVDKGPRVKAGRLRKRDDSSVYLSRISTQGLEIRSYKAK